MFIQRVASPLAALSAAAPDHPVAACALSVAQGDDGKSRLIPAGQFSAPKGAMSGTGPWFLDEAHARRIIELAATRGADIVIDYDHQTLLTETNGKPAPASGWIDPQSLEWRPDGLYGHIRWTAAAKALIAPGPDGEPPEYRYLSPVFPYDAGSGAVLDLLHLALTNNPAISDGNAVLAAARRAYTTATQQEEGSDVNREELIKALGLASDATDEQIKAGIAALKANSDQVTALRQALAIGDDEEPVAAVAALKAKADKPAGAEPDLSQYVPRAVYVEATQQLAVLKAGSDTAELDRLIEEGLDDGRIPGKATADWLRKQGLAACKAHLEGAPPMAALKGATQTDGKKPKEEAKGKDGLTGAELAVCKSMGISPEDYRKANPVDDE